MRYKNKFLFCVSVLLLWLSPAVYGQDKVVNISLQRATLRQLLTAIEQQTDYRFSYRTAVLNADSANITLRRQASVRNILQEVLPKRNLEYEMAGSTHIVVRQKEQVATQVSSQGVASGVVVDKQGEPVIGANIVIAAQYSVWYRIELIHYCAHACPLLF